jgi:hypothetical protein
MSKLLQLRGGTTSQHNSFTGAVREVTVDTDKDTLVVHDGSTQGGFALPRTAAQVVALISNDSIDSQHYVADSIDAEHLAPNSVNTDAIIDDSVTSAHLAAGSVDTTALGADSVTTAKIADNVALGGSPTTTTQAESDDSTKIATTAYVVDKITTLIGGAPSTLNDLNELAAAINDDPSYNSTLTTALGTKLPKAGGTVTGIVNFNDSVRAKFGTSGDMSIFHDGSNSYIENTGDGDLIIQDQTGDVYIKGKSGENSIVCNNDGSVELYHNNVKKFETTAAGATVTGTLTADLADNSINSEHYVDGSIDTAHIGNGQVNQSKLAANSVDSTQYVDGSIDTVHLSDGVVTAVKIGNDAINHGDKIADGVIQSEHYADGSIDSEHLAANSVGSSAIQTNAVTSSEIADNTITSTQLASNSVDSSELVDGSIDRSHLSGSMGDLRKGVTHIGRDGNDYMVIGTATHEWHLDGAEDMRLTNAGVLHVENDVIAFSTTISDERLKHDIEPITDALSKVGQLNGVTFTYNKDDKKSAGLIAQDVEKVMPSAVSETELPLQHDDGIAYKTVQYDQTIGLLVEAIKELTAKVEELEAK